MAKRMQFCTALFLSASVFVTGCTVDVQDPNTTESDPTDPSTNTAPVIELMGESVITIPVNTSFVEPGVSASDAEDGDLSSAVYSNSMQVNTSQPGEYEIIYRVTDSGNMAAEPVKRIVIVSEPAVTPEEPAVEPGEPEVLVPAIEAVKLVGFTGAQELVELSTLTNGSVIDLSQTSIDLLNVVADSADVSNTGSVHFKLTGPVNVDRWENNPIYTMVVDTVNLSIAKSQLPVGDYTLSVTPYALPDMEGQKGAVKAVSFKVVDNQIVSNVPKIAAVDFISVSDTGEYLPVSRITEGSEVQLTSATSALANIIAVSEDADATGSVQFTLSGPVEISRAENNPPYALANETQHLALANGDLPEGDYTLIMTPYAEPNTGGEAGIPLIVNFSVVGTIAAPTDPVDPTPVESPVAKADSYTVLAGAVSQPAVAVSANDTYVEGAEFRITKAPSHGSLTMLDLGFFTYTPDSGFSGADSFTYEISQAGKTSSANVSITVEEPSVTETDSGFTVIKPSADSKLIYVSSSMGSDANTCLSQAAPCKTIAAGLEKMRNGYPDHLYLKRGDTWRDEKMTNLHSGRSAAEPAVMSYYGSSGPRPKLENSSNALHVFKGKMVNFSFIGLEFSAYKLDPKNSAFTGDAYANIVLLGGNENILFEDNKFSLTEIIIQKWDSGAPTNITLRRNIWTGAYYNSSSFDQKKRPSNIYADGVVGLIMEENVFDRGGWHPTVAGAGANMYNHNIYIQKTTDGSKLLLKNNIITRGASHGAQLRGGGLAEDNFFARNAVGLMFGYWDPIPTGVRAYAYNNVISEGEPMIKGKDACTGPNLCTAAVWGLEYSAMGYADWKGEGNYITGVFDNKTWSSKYSKLVRSAIHTHKDQASTVKLANNVVYKWGNDSEGADKYPNAGRTLGSYNETLGGANSFDDFMNVVLNRPVGTWDSKYTASAINKYIRAGFTQ